MTWRVAYEPMPHVPDSPMCKGTCGKGQTLIAIGPDGTHVMGSDFVADIIDEETGEHVVCFGHDYDDRGYTDAATAERIVAAVNQAAK